jgi:phosphoribosylpyrophosphate synthetase
MRADPLRLFAPSESRGLAEGIAACLGLTLGELEERMFEDGEQSMRPCSEVRGCHCVVVQSLYAEPDKGVGEKLCRLLFLVAALKDAAARRVTALLPYLCYARADRRTEPQGPVTHGLFAGAASRALLAESELEQLAVTNTVRPLQLPGKAVGGRLAVLDVAPLIAEAVSRDLGADSMPEVSR